MNKINVLSGFALLFLLSTQSQAISPEQASCTESSNDQKGPPACVLLPKEGCSVNCLVDSSECDAVGFEKVQSIMEPRKEMCMAAAQSARSQVAVKPEPPKYHAKCVNEVCKVFEMSAQEQQQFMQRMTQQMQQQQQQPQHSGMDQHDDMMDY